MPTYTRIDSFIINALGQAQAGASVYYLANQPGATPQTVNLTSLAAVFADTNGVTTAANPQIADGFGHAAAYVESGLITLAYVLQNGVVQQVLPDQTINIATASTAAIINATTGFQVNGAAPLNDVLIGNGTVFVPGVITTSSLSGTIALTQTPLTTVGDILVVNGTPALDRLGGNITTARMFLNSTGTGVAANIPSWSPVAWNDLAAATDSLVLDMGNNETAFLMQANSLWTWANVQPATSGASRNSPSLLIQGNYWTGGASAPDVWSIQDQIGVGTNGSSTLLIEHFTGTLGSVEISTNARIVCAGITSVNNDADGTSFTDNGAGGIFLDSSASGGIFLLSQGATSYVQITNTGSGEITLIDEGNGINLNCTGTGAIQLTTLTGGIVITTTIGSAPTSAGTAGTEGQILRHAGLLDFCSATAAAGAATWKVLSMTAV